RFTFELPTMEPGAQVRWRILGMAEQWSAWTPVADASLTLRSLDGGEYRLEVQGRTPGRRPVKEFSYTFAATPHWYRTPAAWVAAALLLLALVVLVSQLIARLRYRQIAAVNRRLEQMIAERTRELEDANRRLAELATEDSLTGVANRRALEHALEREWERCGELGLPLAVVMIDVDHFKQFNDRHGHLEGDQRLRWVAERLGTQVRPVRELLARFGGEEFALVLPGHGVDEAMDRAERLRRLFEAADSELTISLGVAVEVPSEGRQPDELLRAADTALYHAKRNGRNVGALARRGPRSAAARGRPARPPRLRPPRPPAGCCPFPPPAPRRVPPAAPAAAAGAPAARRGGATCRARAGSGYSAPVAAGHP